MRQCHIHTELALGDEEWCPRCMEAWEARRPAETMTGEEREREMEQIAGPLQIPFENLHQRIEELVGRPVFTHEMSSRNWSYLVQEAGNRVHPSPEAVVNLIPEEKRIVIEVPR